MVKRHGSVLQDRLPCKGWANWSIHCTDLGRTALHTRESQGGRATNEFSKTNAANSSRGYPAWQDRGRPHSPVDSDSRASAGVAVWSTVSTAVSGSSRGTSSMSTDLRI